MIIDLLKEIVGGEPSCREQGRRLEPTLIWRDCYHLLAVFAASSALREQPWHLDLARDWEETEANRLLLNVAIVTRDTMDTAFAEPECRPVGREIPDIDTH